jgi:cysteine-S-conjugate beta-lyase
MTNKHNIDTDLLHIGRYSESHFGVVSMPAYKTSTILFPSYSKFKQADCGKLNGKWQECFTYGRKGTPTVRALEEAFMQLEDAAGALITPSGLSAITMVLQSLLGQGDHWLMADCVYAPTRLWGNTIGKSLGVSFDSFPPRASIDELEALIKPNTKVIFLETPGSLTFELQDVSAVSALAKKYNIKVVVDNTFAAGYFFKPLQHGADVSIQSGTKYILGHSDGLLGLIACTADIFPVLQKTHHVMGLAVDGDTAYNALRGLRTLPTRLKAHYNNGLQVAEFLQQQTEITDVWHPALPSFPDYDLWKRDFTGASGLFSFVLKKAPEQALQEFIDHLQLFGLGYSWGGFESLALPCFLDNVRTCGVQTDSWVIRLHIGLENTQDLICDLRSALDVYKRFL